jgi:hypothetical protein
MKYLEVYTCMVKITSMRAADGLLGVKQRANGV